MTVVKMRLVMLGLILLAATLGAVAARAETETSELVISSQERAERGTFRRFIPFLSFVRSEVVDPSVAEGADGRSRFGGGVLFDIGGSGSLVFESGLVYRSMGADFFNDSVYIQLDLGYLSAPLIGKYYFSGQERNSLYFKSGFMPSYQVSRRATDFNYPGQEQIYEAGLRRFELAMTSGLGANVQLSPDYAMVFDLTYVRGLTPIADRDGFNSAFVFSTGMAFGI